MPRMRDASRRSPSCFLLAPLALVGLIAASCGSDDHGPADELADPQEPATAEAPATTAAEPMVSGEVVVFAAASLTDAFTELGDAFTAANSDASVIFSFAASSKLVAQIIEGAPADVYASADLSNMTKLTDAGANAADPVIFAGNESEIVVAPDNPLGIAGVEDLADDDLILVVCAPEVPCGAYASQIFENTGIEPTADSYEENVRAVLTKVTLGEADAGIVYATDVTAAGDDADGVAIPGDLDVVAEYPIAITSESPNPDGAQAFIDFVLGDDGQAILASYGFTSP